MDEADIAQRNQELLERRNLEAHLSSMPQGESAEECEECGATIPEKRRQAAPGYTRCIRCQEDFERRRR